MDSLKDKMEIDEDTDLLVTTVTYAETDKNHYAAVATAEMGFIILDVDLEAVTSSLITFFEDAHEADITAIVPLT